MSGGRRDREVCQTIKCPKCGTHLPVGSRLNPFGNFWEALGAGPEVVQNVEGGFHSPFPVKTKLGRSPKVINCYVHPHRNLYWLEALHQHMDEMQSSQFKISGLLQPFLVLKPHNHWRPILGLSRPNISETIRTTLQQWEWVTSTDFKDAYFHIPTQESRTYQISCPGSDIPVQSTVFQSVHCTHGAHCSSIGVETDGHTRGYNNPPVLTRLVGESHIPPELAPAYTRSSENMPSIRLAGEFRKIGTGSQSRSLTL